MLVMLLRGSPERPDPTLVRRRGKEARERAIAAALLLPCTPLLAAAAVAITAEGLIDPDARGPVLVTEPRISRGRVIHMLKLRTLDAAGLARARQAGDIKAQERAGRLTRTGRVLKAWYLDELPQLWNIVRGDMFLIGTRPYPVHDYEAELARGVTRKRDMPAGLIGPVQAHKGASGAKSELELDADYWEAFRTWPAWRLLLLDLTIVWRSLKVQLAHQGL